MAGYDFKSVAETVLQACTKRELMLATAESCTGGLVASTLVSIPGSSAVVERGYVTYSNSAKIDLLGVPEETIEQFGAVSEETAIAMAEGALGNAPVDLAVAITGIAGPGGGSAEKPEGLVHFACARKERVTAHDRIEFGAIGRNHVRERSAWHALEMLLIMARA